MTTGGHPPPEYAQKSLYVQQPSLRAGVFMVHQHYGTQTVNDETMQEINTLLIALDKTWDDDLLPLCSQIFRRDIRASSELTQAEAVKALGFLKQKATEQKVAA